MEIGLNFGDLTPRIEPLHGDSTLFWRPNSTHRAFAWSLLSILEAYLHASRLCMELALNFRGLPPRIGGLHGACTEISSPTSTHRGYACSFLPKLDTNRPASDVGIGIAPTSVRMSPYIRC